MGLLTKTICVTNWPDYVYKSWLTFKGLLIPNNANYPNIDFSTFEYKLAISQLTAKHLWIVLEGKLPRRCLVHLFPISSKSLFTAEIQF